MSPVSVSESPKSQPASEESALAKQIASTQDTQKASPQIPSSSPWDQWFELAFLCILGIGFVLLIFLYWAG